MAESTSFVFRCGVARFDAAGNLFVHLTHSPEAPASARIDGQPTHAPADLRRGQVTGGGEMKASGRFPGVPDLPRGFLVDLRGFDSAVLADGALTVMFSSIEACPEWCRPGGEHVFEHEAERVRLWAKSGKPAGVELGQAGSASRASVRTQGDRAPTLAGTATDEPATPVSGSKEKAAPKAEAAPKTKAAPEARAASSAKAARGARAAPKAKTSSKAKAAPKAKASSKAKAAPKAKTSSKAKAAPKAKANSKAKAAPKAEASPEAKTSPKAGTASNAPGPTDAEIPAETASKAPEAEAPPAAPSASADPRPDPEPYRPERRPAGAAEAAKKTGGLGCSTLALAAALLLALAALA